MEVEDDGPIRGEEAVEVPVVEAVGMLRGRSHAVQVDDVDEADLEVREVLAQQRGRRLGESAAAAAKSGRGGCVLTRCSGRRLADLLRQQEQRQR